MNLAKNNVMLKRDLCNLIVVLVILINIVSIHSENQNQNQPGTVLSNKERNELK